MILIKKQTKLYVASFLNRACDRVSLINTRKKRGWENLIIFLEKVLTRRFGQSESFNHPQNFKHSVLIRVILFLAIIPFLLAGCTSRVSTFEVVDFREPGKAHTYRESFDEAFYDVDQSGNVNIVIFRESPSTNEPDENITQIIYIHTMWTSIPGTTVAHRSQINGTVTYGIVGGRMGVTFEGAGSVFFNENKKKHELTGTLELARLRPTRKLTEDSTLFHHAELSGNFFAVRDRRRVVRTINEMNRMFGPLPVVGK